MGPITSLAYVLTLEDPHRFSGSREVGPYLGLVPKQEDSGDSQPQLGISKAGDRMLRRLLVGSSQYMLGAFGPALSNAPVWGPSESILKRGTPASTSRVVIHESAVIAR